MKKLSSLLLLIIGALILAPNTRVYSDNAYYDAVAQMETVVATPTPTASQIPAANQSDSSPNNSQNPAEQTNLPEIPPSPTPTPTITPTPDPFADLYNCEMSLQFLNGPFETRSVDFEVLGRDYFTDKADKFAPGKGTSIYYEAHRYFILHSSYVNGNILKPMEAEFIRRYLENWGGTDKKYIQANIDQLIGSEALWICDGKRVFKTEISGITRLSHIASQELWLEPQNLNSIIEKREGLVSEWIGDLNKTDEPSILVGFCGWGPNTTGNARYTYFRYLINFEVVS